MQGPASTALRRPGSSGAPGRCRVAGDFWVDPSRPTLPARSGGPARQGQGNAAGGPGPGEARRRPGSLPDSGACRTGRVTTGQRLVIRWISRQAHDRRDPSGYERGERPLLSDLEYRSGRRRRRCPVGLAAPNAAGTPQQPTGCSRAHRTTGVPAPGPRASPGSSGRRQLAPDPAERCAGRRLDAARVTSRSPAASMALP
jgi:hypothetical protein